MLYCEKCHVSIRGARHNCPLCQGDITGSNLENDEVFPEITTIYHSHLFLKMLSFISVIIITLTVTINLLISHQLTWSIFVVAGIICTWISLVILIAKGKNILKNLLWQSMVISILAIVWDYAMNWHGWSIDYVVPILCTVTMVTMSILARWMHLHTTDYMIYLIIGSLFGTIPIIFITIHWVHFVYPSLVCILSSIIFLAALICFQGKKMVDELKRRLHL